MSESMLTDLHQKIGYTSITDRQLSVLIVGRLVQRDYDD